MFSNLFDADDYSEEALVKIVTSLTIEDLEKSLRQGEILKTEWLSSRLVDADFRVIVQGRRIGMDNDRIIDVRSTPNGRLVWLPGEKR